MGLTTPLAAVERERIIAALREGKSQNAVAKLFNRSAGCVNRLAREADLEYSRPKHAAEALRDYCQANRVALGNKLFRHVEQWITRDDLTTSQLQSLITSYAILTDKRRLEDGEVTARTEDVSADNIRADVAGRLDELAQRRRTQRAS